MKKIIAFTLVFVMLFSLSACDIQGAVEDAVLGAVENQAEKMNAELGRSKAEGNVLSVESVGITFVKPYSWEFLEDDAIKEMVGTAGDVLEIGDFASKIAGIEAASLFPRPTSIKVPAIIRTIFCKKPVP